MPHLFLIFSLVLLNALFLHAQSTPSTSMQVPPLQWISLSSLLKGSAPPPLRDPVIGYDEGTRSLLIFGGQTDTAGNVVTSSTYILNLDTLTWSQPSPSVNLPSLASTPPARSKALAGADVAANQRRSLVMFGGRGLNGVALDDIWSYDYADSFWAEVAVSGTSPSARWGSAGGTDQTFSIRVPNPPNFQTNFWVMGGNNGSFSDRLSDAWQAVIDGSLSPNSPSVTATWQELIWSSQSSRLVGEASTVLPPNDNTVSYGGCNSPVGGQYNASCAVQDAFVLSPIQRTTQSLTTCPVSRFAAALVPNYNSFSNNFATQVMLLFGSYDPAIWNSSTSFQNGEVDILDTSSSNWARVIPANDPTSPLGRPPGREGAAVLSYPSALVGSSRNLSSDTIIFGGQDIETGQLLQDVWILRAYNSAVTGSNQKWSGFGNGILQSGVDANGAGVQIIYLNQCATHTTSNATNATQTTQSASTSLPSSSIPSSPTPSPTPSPSAPSQTTDSTAFEVSIAHKALSPLAVAVFLVGLLILRPYSTTNDATRLRLLFGAATIAASAGCAISGIAIASKTASSTLIMKRARDGSEKFSSTPHAISGIILFTLLVASGAVMVVEHCASRRPPIESMPNPVVDTPDDHETGASQYSPRPSSVEANGEKTPKRLSTAGLLPRTRTHSLASMTGLFEQSPPLTEGVAAHSTRWSDARPMDPQSSQTTRRFEVVNRPKHLRAQSMSYSTRSAGALPLNLGDISWLHRRRSLDVVGELDYALSRQNEAHEPPCSQTYPTTEAPLEPYGGTSVAKVERELPLRTRVLRLFFALVVLGNIAFTLQTLFTLNSPAPFAVFLAWVVLFYATVIALSWHGIPHHSNLARFAAGLRRSPSRPVVVEESRRQRDFPNATLSDAATLHTIPNSTYSPAVPNHRSSLEQSPINRQSITYMESDPEDDCENDDEKQQQMEREMQRRDVSIITVPRRPLRIANV